MTIYKLSSDALTSLQEVTFQSAGLLERQDLQPVLREQLDVIVPGAMVLAEEFSDWEDSRRRIDLLALDKDARLVVIELKRTEDGGHMELQALRYAAMVSTMTFDDAVRAHETHLDRLGRDDDARQVILNFLGWDEEQEEDFAQDVRIVLVSADFSKELTTAVLWLNSRAMDIQCIRLKPYRHDGDVFVDVQLIIPLPEAAEYTTKVGKKKIKEKVNRQTRREKFTLTIDGIDFEGLAKNRTMNKIVSELVRQGVTPDRIRDLLPWRVNTLFLQVPGLRDSSSFVSEATRLGDATDRPFAKARWLLADGDLIHHEGDTYALSSTWGGRTREAIQSLLSGCEGHNIICRSTVSEQD